VAEFNLIDEPWIPCIDLHGVGVECGIRDTLLRAHELREICDESPLVTVAIHRLLLAVLYRALAGPRDFVGWTTCYERGAFDEGMIQDYLNEWRERFDLLAERHPFFQMERLETKTPVSVARLATECASGNNATLFDHSSDDEEVSWSAARASRYLVACQSFALGFGKSGTARIHDVDEELPYSRDAIALRGLNVWLEGEDLFESLVVNLVPNDDSSLPPWELENPNEYRDRLKGKDRKTVASLGLVDLLTWQSRLIRLIPHDSRVSAMYFTQGRSADKSASDPMKVYRTSKEEGVAAVALNSGKAAWRDAHSMFAIPTAQSNERRPECFNLVARAHDRAVVASKVFMAQVVGLASAPGKAGKFVLWRHERMPVSATLLSDADVIERIGQLLQEAEQVASELNRRMRRIVRLYLSPDAESDGGRQPDKDDVSRVVEAVDSRPVYWARLERHFFDLLQNLRADLDELGCGPTADNGHQATNEWHRALKHEARRALEESVRSLGTTARVVQSVARVSTVFDEGDMSPRPPRGAKTNARAKGGKKSES